jgi:hypothetical protein
VARTGRARFHRLRKKYLYAGLIVPLMKDQSFSDFVL